MIYNQHKLIIVILMSIVLIFMSCLPSSLPMIQNVDTSSPQTTAPDTETPFLPYTNTPIITPSLTNTLTPAPTVIPSPTQVIYGPSNYPSHVNPLTGLVAQDPSLLNRRPVMIKISNYPPQLRPHSGLSFADIVFEHYIGEGTNRFTALFYGNDVNTVGPIRSARYIDAQLVSMYQGIFGFASADHQTLTYIRNALTNRAFLASAKTCPAICNYGSLDVTADTHLLSQYAVEKNGVNNKRYKLDGMVFNPIPPKSELQASQITTYYNAMNIGEWRYDSKTGLYLRWIEDMSEGNQPTLVPLLDKLTGEQLGFANIVVVFANHKELTPTLHEIDIQRNTTGQPLILFRDGYAYNGIWMSQGVESDTPLIFLTAEGEYIHFKPGNSWVVIMSLTSKLNQYDSDKWEIRFSIY